MDSEKGKFQFSGLKFLYEMELVYDPQLINNLKLNIFSTSKHIKEVELLSSYYHKSILVWLDLSWFGNKFLSKKIISGVEERVSSLLPKFKNRAVTDKRIFNSALSKVNNALKGVSHEKTGNSDGESNFSN